MAFTLSVHAVTDRGLFRASNQDAIVVDGWFSQTQTGTLTCIAFPLERPTLVAVADGVGGNAAGDVASRIALLELVAAHKGWTSTKAISDGLAAISTQIESIAERIGQQGMATTIAGLAFGSTSILSFNVGDSRVYRVTADGVDQLSTDDVVPDEDGQPTHIITQCLGGSGETPQPHLAEIPLAAGRYIVCSDGIHGVLTASDIEAACHHTDGKDVAEKLIDTAIAHRTRDNYSLLVVDLAEAY
ncbi:PP2C family protein-serine/threonine phosphatase [Hoyosella subflava]|uniref:Serine/threonine phosphatase n=1 Tax=Hoyosella subflava (strain DSM 45089 / JCM 17490 / NBRC 109087 / DQS3-9A1) TaxID=443218 RepID=F6EHE0_HOYSD|nr:PP2C family serine/threonine-protein phosphatase [Hoyosella subflava]AEF41119.1 Serine/threonine phosphatase [Hoyosella subflava DQS3-9A1]